MKKSKIDTADTRKRILTAASKLFLKNGLAETGIAHIMSAAGLTQGGFYRHFDSKDQLIAEANNAANDQMFDQYAAAAAGLPPREALDTVVNFYLYQSQMDDPDGLCPLPNLGSELRNSNDQVRMTAMDGYQRLVLFFATLTKQLKISDAENVADSIVATMVGAVMLSRVAVNPMIAKGILDSTKMAIDSLVSTESKTLRHNELLQPN